jgi:hypothetical protein
MWVLFFYLPFCISLKVDFIPPTRSPPPFREEPFTIYLKSRDSIIIFGGYNDVIYLADLWEFSLKTLLWDKIILWSTESPRKLHSAPRGILGGFPSHSQSKFYIFGGYTYLGPENDLWEFDFDTNKWQKIPTFNTPPLLTFYAYTDYVDDGIQYFVVQSGQTRGRFINDLYR